MIKNQALNTAEPGLKKRLTQAFTHNIAQTRDDHRFAELRTPSFEIDRGELWQRCLRTGEQLGWQLKYSDRQSGHQHWVVTTAWLNFKDDLTVDIESAEDGVQHLSMRSASRKGRADLGANAHHIRVYLQQLRS